jgi:nitrogen fixation protein NifX
MPEVKTGVPAGGRGVRQEIMMSSIITREAALRLGLAARELGRVGVAAFAEAVGGRLGLPLTETRLCTLTVSDLREILAGCHADEDGTVGVDAGTLKRAVRLLWGEDLPYSELPGVDAYAEGSMPGSVRVACASNVGEVVDGHFGSCERFLIYQVTPDQLKLVALRPTLEADHDHDRDRDRNAARAALINDCDVVFVLSIGGPAAAKVIRANVHPVKVAHAESARAVIARLQDSLRAPSPWLAKAMGVEAPSLARFVTAGETE